jgi:hypothetical protein
VLENIWVCRRSRLDGPKKSGRVGAAFTMV